LITCALNKLVYIKLAITIKEMENDASLLDDELYRKRFVVERTNAWLNGFKAILVHFETKSLHWKCLNIIAFWIILLRQL